MYFDKDEMHNLARIRKENLKLNSQNEAEV